MNNKITGLIIILLLLPSCSKCFFPLTTVTCGGPYNPWPSIAHYQKPGQLGHTNSEQRWQAAVSCGAEYGDKNLRSAITRHKNDPVDMGMREAFMNCMAKNGYIYIKPIDCGTQNPGEDTGKCNL